MAKLIHFVNKKNFLEFAKYTLASTLALAVDYGCYWLLVINKILDIPKAAVLGYSIGLIVAYYFIADKIFQNGWLGDKKTLEIFFFSLSGLIGITLTYITVKIVILFFGERPNLAKITAIGVSFLVVYVVRKIFVFRKKTSF